MKKRILIPICAIVLLAVAGVVTWLILRSGSEKSYFNILMMETEGSVKVKRDGDSMKASEGMKMRDKDRLVVASDGFARVNCDRKTYAHFEHDTEATFKATSNKKLTINLVKGEMVVEVQKKMKSDESLSIKTSNSTMAIRGTVVAIRVDILEDGLTRTINYCLEGKATVSLPDGSEQTLEAGTGWLVITDEDGELVVSEPAGAGDLKFDGIEIDGLRGADDTPMKLNYSLPSKMFVKEGEIPIDDSHFPDISFRLYVMDQIDTDGNWALSPEERNAVTTLSVRSNALDSLVGIEYFPNLTYLDCSSNFITKLDMSKNTELLTLHCEKNQLTELNISGCEKLSYLDCGHNELTVLDISGNPGLTDLSCEENSLTELDVTGLKALVFLECDHNELTKLDITNNKFLMQVHCYANHIKEIDLTHSVSLVAFYAYNNELTSIDVSRNSALQQLYVGDNELTSVDVSNNLYLLGLSVYNNHLTELDLLNNTRLELLNCSSNELTALNVRHCPDLDILDCAFNENITELDLENNTKLTSLNIIYTQIREIDLSNNPLVDNPMLDTGFTKVIR